MHFFKRLERCSCLLECVPQHMQCSETVLYALNFVTSRDSGIGMTERVL